MKKANHIDLIRSFFKKDTPLSVKLLLIVALVYLVAPIDILPDFFSLIGWADDIAVLTGLSSLALNLLNRYNQQRLQEPVSY